MTRSQGPFFLTIGRQLYLSLSRIYTGKKECLSVLTEETLNQKLHRDHL